MNGGSVELLTGTGRTLRQGAADFLQGFRWSAVRAGPTHHYKLSLLWYLL